MEFENLLKKIIDDADIKAQSIREEAHKESLSIISDAYEKSKAEAQAITNKASKSAKETYEKIMSSSELMYKKKILSKKRSLIDEAFLEALNVLKNMSLEEYKNFIAEKTKDLKENAKIEISEKYYKDIDDKFLKSKNPHLEKSDKTVEWGFNIVLEKSNINYNFCEIIERLKVEKAKEVSDILLGV